MSKSGEKPVTPGAVVVSGESVETTDSGVAESRCQPAASYRQSRKKMAAAYHRKIKESGTVAPPEKPGRTAIMHCVHQELRRYFDILDGQEPANVYSMVMRQAERALIESVMDECGGNQSKAAKWLGISRGNLRKKLADMGIE